MTTRLRIYCGALANVGERSLASLDEDRGPRWLLDEVWDNGAVDYLLGTAQWRFAKRSVELQNDTDIETNHGYQYAFAKPDDFIRTIGMFPDESLSFGETRYRYEAGYFYADTDTLWLSYISNDADYGGNLADWPANFAVYAELYFAIKILTRLTGAKADPERIEKRLQRARQEAVSTDAMEDPMTFPPGGSWVRSRGGGYRGDRGVRSRLIG